MFFCFFFSFYLLIARLHAQEDDVRRRARQTSFQVRLTSDLLGLHIVGVQRLHRLLQQSSLDLFAEKHAQRSRWRCDVFFCFFFSALCVLCAHPVVELRGELGQEAADGSVAVVPLDEDLGHQRRTVPQLLEVVELKDEHIEDVNEKI